MDINRQNNLEAHRKRDRAKSKLKYWRNKLGDKTLMMPDIETHISNIVKIVKVKAIKLPKIKKVKIVKEVQPKTIIKTEESDFMKHKRRMLEAQLRELTCVVYGGVNITNERTGEVVETTEMIPMKPISNTTNNTLRFKHKGDMWSVDGFDVIKQS